MKRRVLLVDDDGALLDAFREGLEQRGYAVRTCPDPRQAAAAAIGCDAVVTDLRMPCFDGLELARQLCSRPGAPPVLLLTAFGQLETAVEALRLGITDFLSKPISLADLDHAIARAIRFHGRRASLEPTAVLGLDGASPAMELLRTRIGRLAPLDGTILVRGETGTGKERVAAALHAGSRRASGPFVPVNCAALPEALAESELFGHVRGAFTDARSDRSGLLRDANGGTLFLDEVGDLPIALQPKLLRALEVRRVRPVGGPVEIPVDIRIIAATHRDLEGLAAEGRFRADLYYRLDELHLDVPALRDRADDVKALAGQFVAEAAVREGLAVSGFSAAALATLVNWSWPGNVRELRHVVYQAAVLCDAAQIDASDLPPRMRREITSSENEESPPDEAPVSLDDVERAQIERVLRQVGGNRTEAARLLGCDRKTLYRKLRAIAGSDDVPPN